MKISTANDSVVERSGLSSDGAYGIVFNAKMAKILSDGLYSDKVQSIIRELSCNAWDSHVEAGKSNVPIEVHLPTWLEPWFHVRDFGTGMDHQQVISVYTVYGVSTKVHSNDFIGQLGLGCKSPFSYVDAFDVTAIKDGIQRQYSMYKNETGMPSVALLGETKTTEPDGVTVKMPVRRDDIERFSDKARRVFRWFNPAPRITGVERLEIPVYETAFEGQGWKILKSTYYRHSAMALMGRVAYPLDTSSVKDLSEAQNVIMGLPMVLEFGIGDLEVAASREALGYDDRTQKNIRDRMATVLDELARLFEQKMTNARTEWEARETFGSIFGHESGFRWEFERAFGRHGLRWNNMVIKESHVTLKLPDIWDPQTVGQAALYRNSGYKRLRQIKHDDSVSIACGDNSMIVFNDLDKGGLSRVNFAQDQGTYAGKNLYYFENTGSKTRQEILDMLGNPPYELTSNMPKRPASARTKIGMMRYVGGMGSKAWVSVDVDLEDGGLYVMLDRWNVMHWNGKDKTDQLSRVVDSARKLGILGEHEIVYAPRGHFRKQVEASDEWLSLWDVVIEEVNKRLTPQVLQALADQTHYAECQSSMNDKGLWQYNWKLNNQNGTMARFVAVMRQLEANGKQSNNNHILIDLATIMNGSVNSVPPSVNAERLFAKVKEEYPMLDLLLNTGYYHSSSRFEKNSKVSRVVESYINQCDDLARRAAAQGAAAVMAA